MMVVLIIAYNYENNAGATKDISYSDFLNMLEPVEGKNLSANYIKETLTNTTKSKSKRRYRGLLYSFRIFGIQNRKTGKIQNDRRSLRQRPDRFFKKS